MSSEKYDKIINLPHHVSKKHKPMSRTARAAQFSPFAALTGFEDDIDEERIETEARFEVKSAPREVDGRPIDPDEPC